MLSFTYFMLNQNLLCTGAVHGQMRSGWIDNSYLQVGAHGFPHEKGGFASLGGRRPCVQSEGSWVSWSLINEKQANSLNCSVLISMSCA